MPAMGVGEGIVVQCSKGHLRELPPTDKWVMFWRPGYSVSFTEYSPRSLFT